MTLELLRTETPATAKIDPNFQVVLLISLLGLVLSLIVLPLSGIDLGTLMVMGG